MEELVASGAWVDATVGEDGAFYADLRGLAYGKTYYFVAVAHVQGKVFYGKVKDFATEVLPEVVDLGLSVKWRSWNLGATKPEEYGNYYAWGETEPKEDYSWDTYAWADLHYYHEYGEEWYDVSFTKYCPSTRTDRWSGEGSPDGKTVLDAADDAATAMLGGSWRMPTNDEFAELRNTDNCSWEWITRNGINGMTVTSKKVGFTDRWVFFPAAGYRSGTGLPFVGSYGYYWSSSLSSGSTGDPCYAHGLYFYAIPMFYGFSNNRYCGFSVRPVSE